MKRKKIQSRKSKYKKIDVKKIELEYKVLRVQPRDPEFSPYNSIYLVPREQTYAIYSGRRKFLSVAYEVDLFDQGAALTGKSDPKYQPNGKIKVREIKNRELLDFLSRWQSNFI